MKQKRKTNSSNQNNIGGRIDKRVLAKLSADTGLKVSDIATSTKLSKSCVSACLKRLEQKEKVTSPSPMKRNAPRYWFLGTTHKPKVTFDICSTPFFN